MCYMMMHVARDPCCRGRALCNGAGAMCPSRQRTTASLCSSLVHVSVDFIGDDCHASVARRPVEAGGSFAVKPIRAECDAETARMIVFNELGHPIHIVEILAADRREVASR